MGTILLRPTSVLLDGECQETTVSVRDGKITALGEAAGDDAAELEGTLLPGFVDLQVNGAGGHSVDEGTDKALEDVALAVALSGTSAFLPTVITAPFDRLCDQVRAVADWIEAGPHPGAIPLGIHVEGPFLEVSGTHDSEEFRDPTPERIDALLDAAQGHLALVTLAPGRAGAAAATARLSTAGVAVSLGHASSTEGFAECVDAGASLVTHLYNAMSPLHHRDPGIVGLSLDEARLSCALILDGAHVSPTAARIAYRCLGPERTILVTDCVSAAGMPDGDYPLAGTTVHLQNGVVRDDRGRLAGSALTMAGAARGFLEMIDGVGAAELARVASTNPARAIGRTEFGAIEVGARASFALLSGDGSVRAIAY